MKTLSTESKSFLSIVVLCAVMIVGMYFLWNTLFNYVQENEQSEEISLLDYKMLRVDIKLDCFNMPQHCKMLKDKIRGYFADGKVTKKEYYEYIMFTSSLYQDPKAKESLLKTLE